MLCIALPSTVPSCCSSPPASHATHVPPTPVATAQGRAEQRRVQTYLAVRDWVFSFNVPRLLYNCTPLRLVTGPAEYVPPPGPLPHRHDIATAHSPVLSRALF